MKKLFVLVFSLLLTSQLAFAEALSPEKVNKLHQAIETRKAKDIEMSAVQDLETKTDMTVSAEEDLWDSVTELFEAAIPVVPVIAPEPIAPEPGLLDRVIDSILKFIK